jgi:putative ABC transport system permease protein
VRIVAVLKKYIVYSGIKFESPMFQNYLQTILRDFRRGKSYSLITLLGFSAGIMCFLIAGLYLNHELRFDQHFQNHKNIYRIAATRTMNGATTYTAMGPPQIGSILSNGFPEVQSYVNFLKQPTLSLYRDQDNVTDWDNIYSVDGDVFDMFSHNIIYGYPDTALIEPQSIAISESFAAHYFGNTNPIGEAISERGLDYKVTLVFEDLPDNTHLKYNALISMALNPLMFTEGRRRSFTLLLADYFYTYLEMSPNYDPSKFRGISEQYFDANLDYYKGTASLVHILEPLSEIHLNSSTENDLPRGNKSSAYILSALALAVLFVACTNYVNLATARSSKRSKEIGVRKVLGATRKQLFLQFMLESLCFVFLGFLIAMGLLYILINFTELNQILGTAGILTTLSLPILVFGTIAAVVVITLVSGFYPAVYLASVSPNSALNRSAHLGPRAAAIRRGLLTLQFTVSIVIVSSTYLMYSQLDYLNGRPLGYDKENKIFVDVLRRENVLRLSSLIAELEMHNNILGVTVTQNIPGEIAETSTPIVETNDGIRRSMTINHVIADDKYLDVMGIQLLEGRNLDPADRDEIGRTNLVNEAFVKLMDWDEPLGKKWELIKLLELSGIFIFRACMRQYSHWCCALIKKI